MFDLQRYLAEKREVVDKELDARIPAESERPSKIHEAIRSCVFSGGKRVRPIMCMASSDAVGASAGSAIVPAVAVELLHTYTLIHDDLPCMDDDDLRRGKPTCHIAFGEANAVLAGDALQAMAFEILATISPPSPHSPNSLCFELARSAGSMGVAGGQVEDLAVRDNVPTRETLEYIHKHKTAVLFRAATRMGAIAGGADNEQLSALTDYGMNVGLAFQIADDLLDKDGAKKDMTSCLSVYDYETAHKKARAHVDDAVSALNSFEKSRAEPLVAIAEFVINRTN